MVDAGNSRALRFELTYGLMLSDVDAAVLNDWLIHQLASDRR
jgi:hypothetical protein